MPDIAVASTAAVVAAVPAASSGNTADAGQSQAAGPFAQVLQQQIDNPAASDITTSRLASVITAAADTATPTDIENLLPMLVGSAILAGATSAETGLKAGVKALDEDSDTPITDAVPIVAAFTAPVTSVPVAMTGEASSTPKGGTANPSSAVPAANLAANAELAAPVTDPTAQTSDPQESLLQVNPQEIRAAALATAAAASAHSGQVANTVSGTAHQAAVNTPVGARGWDAEVGNQLVWMAGNQSSRAELVLTPPHMGRIEVSLTMNGDQATATFVSANPAVREAIENAVPRLREVLADAGVTLGQTQVGSDSPQQPASGNENGDNSFKGPTMASASASAVSMSTSGSWPSRGRGLVDVFA